MSQSLSFFFILEKQFLLNYEFACFSLGARLIHTMSFLFFFSFIFISWRLITLQYCSGICHTLT